MVMPNQKRAVVNLTDKQHEQIQAAAEKLGLTVPQYCRIAALEKSDGKDQPLPSFQR